MSTTSTTIRKTAPKANGKAVKEQPRKRHSYKSDLDRSTLLGTWTKTVKGSLFDEVGVWVLDNDRVGLFVDHEDEPRGTYRELSDALRHADRLVNGVHIRRYAR